MDADKWELVGKLRLLATRNGDPEVDHAEADRLLVEYIDDQDIADAFDSVRKWYA